MPTITTAEGEKIVSPRLLVKIKQHNVDEAITGVSSHCMIADAIKEQMPHVRFISVDIATIRFSDPKTGLRYTYLTPRVAQINIIRFDDGKKPEPFSFWLRTAMITASGIGSKWGQHKEKNKQRLKRAQITTQASKNTGRVPHIVGGKTPPRPHTRREFGIRAFTIGDRA